MVTLTKSITRSGTCVVGVLVSTHNVIKSRLFVRNTIIPLKIMKMAWCETITHCTNGFSRIFPFFYCLFVCFNISVLAVGKWQGKNMQHICVDAMNAYLPYWVKCTSSVPQKPIDSNVLKKRFLLSKQRFYFDAQKMPASIRLVFPFFQFLCVNRQSLN